MEVLVETGPLAPLGHDGQLGGLDAPHEQQDINVPDGVKSYERTVM